MVQCFYPVDAERQGGFHGFGEHQARMALFYSIRLEFRHDGVQA